MAPDPGVGERARDTGAVGLTIHLAGRRAAAGSLRPAGTDRHLPPARSMEAYSVHDGLAAPSDFLSLNIPPFRIYVGWPVLALLEGFTGHIGQFGRNGPHGAGACTSSVRTPPTSEGCTNAMDAPMEPCRGRSSISRTPPAPSDVRAALISATPYPMWCRPSPRRAMNRPTGVSGPSGSSRWT